MSPTTSETTLIATGEMMLCMHDDAVPYFRHVAPILHEADIVYGHLEVPHTRRPETRGGSTIDAPDPDKLLGLPAAGFSLVSFAGNPTMMFGMPGLIDTLEWLSEHDIAQVGAGMNIDEAIRPVILERDGTKFGFLAYNTIGSLGNGAGPLTAGTAYVDVVNHYEPGRNPGAGVSGITSCEPWSLKAMCDDIERLRSQCDVLIMALHMGLTFQDVKLAEYEFELSYAAIDSGADVILGSHCHVLKGIEFYEGKPIFHCLGNLVCAFPWEDHNMYKEPFTGTRARSRLRANRGGSRNKIDPTYPNYAFPASSRNAALTKLHFSGSDLTGVSCVPLRINGNAEPEVVGKDADGQQVFDYLKMVTDDQGLNARFDWNGDEIIVTEG